MGELNDVLRGLRVQESGWYNLGEEIESGWNNLGEEIEELILAYLPVTCSVRVAAVCKRWRKIIMSPTYAALQNRVGVGKRSWFVLFGINELIHTRSQGFAFDPEEGRWNRVRLSRPPDFNRSSLRAMDGILFASSGPCLSKVCYTSETIKWKWKETSSSNSARIAPLVGVIGDTASSSFKLVLAGGIVDGDKDMVEMYDSLTNDWEICGSIPSEFNGGIFTQWLSSAVCREKFHVLDIHSGDTAFLDIRSKLWSRVRTLSLLGVIYCFLVTCNDRLLVAGVCNAVDGECLKIWNVDEATMECMEVTRMPDSLFSLFKDEDEDKETSLKVVGAGGLIYVFSEFHHKGYPVCMCDVAESGHVTWKRLPPLPPPVHRFNMVFCCSTFVKPSVCLGLNA
eukprot:c21591_g1_i1 orf=123-1310(+)